ncbi:LysE family transporter [Bradyrhizobium sp. USDA 4461]
MWDFYAAAIPSETASWAKIAIVVGGFANEVIWYGFVAVLLSLPGARGIYIRFNAWSNRLVGALLVGFGLRLIYDRS